jgi:hypothetical protein
MVSHYLKKKGITHKDQPRMGMSNAYYSKEDNLYACSCDKCRNKMCWPSALFAEPSAAHYNNPTKHGGLLRRGRMHRTQQCMSRMRAESYIENLEWSLYIYQREYLKKEGFPTTQLIYKRRKKNMEHDEGFKEFLTLFKDLIKTKEGYYLCPVFGKPMVRGEFNPDAHSQWNDMTPSLDRKDNTKPHTTDNLQIISWRANNAKGVLSFNELVQMGKWAEKALNSTID